MSTVERGDQVGLGEQLREDWNANRGYRKSQFVLFMFRWATHIRNTGPRPLSKCVGLIYELVVEWVIGIELPLATQVGRRLRIFHGTGLVVNAQTRIGDDVTIRHGVTIGNAGSSDECPTIGHRVDIGAGAVIVGGIVVGDDARVGANAVVLKDVPARCTAVGVPARII